MLETLHESLFKQNLLLKPILVFFNQKQNNKMKKRNQWIIERKEVFKLITCSLVSYVA